MDVFQVAEYKEYLFDTVKKIFGIDSPSGYYHAVVKLSLIHILMPPSCAKNPATRA